MQSSRKLSNVSRILLYTPHTGTAGGSPAHEHRRCESCTRASRSCAGEPPAVRVKWLYLLRESTASSQCLHSLPCFGRVVCTNMAIPESEWKFVGRPHNVVEVFRSTKW